MKKRPAEFWYTGDYYRAVDLQKCSAATRGIWRDALDAMVNEQIQGKIRGTVEEICRLLRCTEEEYQKFVLENKAHRFANVTHRNGKVTIICRRIYREYKEREAIKKRVSKHRRQKKKKCNANVTPPLSYSTSSSCNNTVTYINPTLQDCYNAAVLLGLTEQQAKQFYEHYKPQGWMWGNNVPMKPPLQDCLVRWRNNQYKFKENYGSSKSKTQRATNRPTDYAEQESKFGQTIE